jgi:hypothetical protein
MHAIAFTGTRSGMTLEQELAVEILVRRAHQLGFEIARHGVCRGSDEDFDSIVKRVGGFLRDGFPACGVRDYDKADIPDLDRLRLADFPLRRNGTFIDRSGLLIACPKSSLEEFRGSGTWAAIRHARKRGIPIYIVYPNGVVAQENVHAHSGILFPQQRKVL